MSCIWYWKKSSQIILKRIFHFFADVGKETNILALKLCTKKDIHIFERLICFLTLCMLITWAFNLTEVQKIRYGYAPTVMAVERDFSGGMSSMPALTICLDTVLNEDIISEFILKKWNISLEDTEYIYYNSFINTLLYSQAENYQFLPTFANDEHFKNIDLSEVLRELQTNMIQISSNFHMNIRATMTERGFCFLINSALISCDNSTAKVHNVPHLPHKKQQPQYNLVLNIKQASGNINVHSTYEISTIDAMVIEFKESQDIKVIFKVMETVASEDLRKLTTQQRKCIFPDEGATFSKFYSQNICLAHCRAKLALKLCQCIPFYYEILTKPNCTIKNFECLKRSEWPTWSFSACNCPTLCTDIKFVLQTVKRKSRNDDMKTSIIRLEIIPPKVRKHRTVVFGYEDLIVSFGGVWTLLLGFSLVTINQLFYVAVLHLLNNLLYLYMYVKQKF